MDGRINYRWDGRCLTPYGIMLIMNDGKRYDGSNELIQDSDGTWVSGWYTVEDEDGNTYPVKDRD